MNAKCICFSNNKGLGYALNTGFTEAIKNKCEYVATFDQDSAVDDGLISKLLNQFLEIEATSVKCAAVAPVFFDRREGTKTYFPFYQEIDGKIISKTPLNTSEQYVEASSLITSGMLVKASAWESGLKYDESLFVDYTDPEWCFRARNLGYKLFGCLNIEMGHAPSDSPPARFFGFSFFRYSPLRRYYYFRNTVRFCLLPYVSNTWKKRLSLGLALRFFVNVAIDEKKLSSLKMMSLGLIHGILGRSGAFTKK